MNIGFSPFNALMEYPQAFDLAAELGLFLEVAYDLHEVDPRMPNAQTLREMGRAAGVGFTVHLPFLELNLASLVPEVAQLSLERVKRSLEFAHSIGAQTGVLHTGLVPLRHPLAIQLATSRLHQALQALQPLPIPVALENLVLTQEDLLQSPAELQALLEQYPSYGFCLDVGHAQIELGPEGYRNYHQLLSQRLIHWHLHDNHGQKDDHHAIGDGGMVNWDWVRSQLAGFGGTIALEVSGGAEGVRKSVAALRLA